MLGRLSANVAAGLLLARTCAASTGDDGVSVMPASLVACVVGAAVVTALLAVCVGHSRSTRPKEPAAPALKARGGDAPPARRPLHEMSDASVEVDFRRAAHQKIDPSHVPDIPPMPPAVLAPLDGSLSALGEFVHELVSKTGGRFGSNQYTIDGTQPIRTGLFSVQCHGKATFGRSTDILFFSSQKDRERQRAFLSSSRVNEFCATVVLKLDETTHEDAPSGLTIRVPDLLITEATKTVDDVISGMKPAGRAVVMSAIARQITNQLVKLHAKGYVLCAVARSNVVLIDDSNPVWTFREYGSYRLAGEEADFVDVRQMPPEAGAAQPVNASPAMDVWLLGVLLFEMFTGNTYWAPEMTDGAVLDSLAGDGGLPHEMGPIGQGAPALQLQKQLIRRILNRDPAERPSADDVKADLDAFLSEGTVQGVTETAWQPPVVNIGR